MLMQQATTVRKEWSAVCDRVIHENLQFIKRTRDKMWFSSLETISEILEAYHFTAMKYIEDDGSVTLSLNEIDLVENGKDGQEARNNLANPYWIIRLTIIMSMKCIHIALIEKTHTLHF